MSEKIIIGCDTCNGEEQEFCDWLIKLGYDAEVSNSTGQGIGSISCVMCFQSRRTKPTVGSVLWR